MTLTRRHRRVAALLLGAACCAAAPASALTCIVPTTPYPTVGAAAGEAACTVIQLAAGSFPENVALARDLALQGAGSTATILQGSFVVAGAGNDVTLDALLVDGTAAGVAGCWTEILSATGGATLTSGADVKVLNTAVLSSGCRLFADGFESGGTRAWSVHSPL